MNSVDRLFSSNFMNVMINTKRLAMIFVLTAILITGSLNAVQYAYSSGPDVLTVKYFGPIATSPADTFIEIYKKIDDFNSPPLATIPIVLDGEEFMVSSQLYFKDKLNSNTVFRVIERTTGLDGMGNPITTDVEIDVVEIHTSCSKPLFIGQTVHGENDKVTLEVVDGTLGDDSILPDNAEGECTDNKKPKHIATITLKKAITNDNGGTIKEANDIELAFDPKIDNKGVDFGVPVNISTKESHTISEAIVPGYSFVLIAGDTECPSMLDEEFTVKKNKDITCIIYNDDNGDGTSSGETGRFFHLGTFEFNISDEIGMCSPGGDVPCMNFFNPTGFIIVPDLENDESDQMLTDTTVILLTVFNQNAPSGFAGCIVTGHGIDVGFIGNDNPADDIPGSGLPGFNVKCPDLSGSIENDTFFANFALMEADV